MSAFETFNTEDLNDLEQSASRESLVIHYSSVTPRKFRGRPVKDWIALVSYGTVLSVGGFLLLIVMASFPRT